MEKKRLHISSGRGPAECNWLVARLVKELVKAARARNVEANLIQRAEGELPNTLLSATVELIGMDLGSFTKEWVGSVLWIGQSPFRALHKRKNWFVEIHEIPLLKDDPLKSKDIKFQATKSSGPGGQHVNKTSSAIRATHVPTNLSVLVQESRSQHQNKKIAIQRLNDLYLKRQKESVSVLIDEQWKMNVEVQRGNPSKIFEGPRFTLKK